VTARVYCDPFDRSPHYITQKGHAKGITAKFSLQLAAMNYKDAQRELAETIRAASDKVKCYFWQLSGDGPNSLSRFLGMEEEELKGVLRLCKIFVGEKDNFSKNNFEDTMGMCHCEWSYCRLNGKVERFINIGKEGKVIIPKDMFDGDGKLLHYPIEDEHVRSLRTKSQKGALPKLLDVANKQASELVDVAAKDNTSNRKESVSPKNQVFSYVQELVSEAVKAGDERISLRSSRKLHRLLVSWVDTAAKELLQTTLERYANEKDCFVAGAGLKEQQSPDKISSTATVVTPPELRPPVVALFDDDSTANVTEIWDNEDIDDDQSTVTTTTITNEFLSDLKEEVILQSLLHKRIHDKKERVFSLVHRNGRRLLVVLPPDSQSVATFEEEANKTKWVDIMLNSEERLDGMLSYLAKNKPVNYVRIGRTKKLSMQGVALNTGQTIALARVARLNDVRMTKLRSFLNKVGKVNLQLSLKEQQRIDIQVGLHRTQEATFGSYLHEWALTKNNEKKAPEQVHYWNCSLSHEVEAEVDLYLKHLFTKKKNPERYDTMPVIDYVTKAFETPGITVLFGGDHGDKHCPISCKINFSSPLQRKTMGQLSYQCPVVNFASVQCTKDTYGLMDNTIMPTIKQQLNELRRSSVVAVYHKVNFKECFRSYIVPSTIMVSTIGLVERTIEVVGANGIAVNRMSTYCPLT
jgi:hypothetical protein